ncbi:hypothetical protein MACH09_06300 [Vibrio sp. MACH09]|uniref:hypothetical protein n=1 Tax=Vibrio sp. MACH09 TaxID=3025122 RepID=UPI0027949918|nr:hypothetical protein [Vibrio sp. MACH09]GLO60122.1 hypothetical protein MACH09_06300 [Vibrio sp. MACH09]
MSTQAGAVVLLVVSVLMSVALLISVSHSQLVYLQVKQGMNEVAERQNYWLAEAGLECAYLQVSHTFPLQHPLDNCGVTPAASVTISPISKTVYRINSHYKTVSLNRDFYFSIEDEPDSLKWLQGSWYEE